MTGARAGAGAGPGHIIYKNKHFWNFCIFGGPGAPNIHFGGPGGPQFNFLCADFLENLGFLKKNVYEKST